jgi:hypothetical protein
VAVCLQSQAKRPFPYGIGRPLTPYEMRAILSEKPSPYRSIGNTPQGELDKAPGEIGVMPNLRACLDALKKQTPHLGQGMQVDPHVYIRDWPWPPPSPDFRARVRSLIASMTPEERRIALERARLWTEYAEEVERAFEEATREEQHEVTKGP